MSKDISKILEGWDFDPNEVVVRLVKGEDGRDKVQLRVDLGLLQMEMDGRPDGTQPEGCRSWLEYYRQKQEAHDAAHPDSAPFELDDEDCRRLWCEGIQYYHRYLSFWHLRLYDLCARDTKRNLELFAFARRHARQDRNKLRFDQWRPYVTMMHARAVGTPLAAAGKIAEALQAIDTAIEGIHEFLDEYEQAHRADECAELVDLERWREQLVTRRDETTEVCEKPSVRLLRKELQQAVSAEQFEEAARLRDEIHRITGQRSVD